MADKVDLWVCKNGHVSDQISNKVGELNIPTCRRIECSQPVEQRTFDVPPKNEDK